VLGQVAKWMSPHINIESSHVTSRPKGNIVLGLVVKQMCSLHYTTPSTIESLMSTTLEFFATTNLPNLSSARRSSLLGTETEIIQHRGGLPM
jgi:hypothetical protein